ncbi:MULTISPECIES: SixA phosphatase family protein [unclassified Ornithinimicrobium]|uniref:SixA phosphatase family protein n=1 Tax=unclassified Ornithinimicrobium TaxID=2615080 RepID=UPI00385293CF
MTRTLVVVRHAKAQHSHPDGDHERELAPRGMEDAQGLGRWLAEQDLLPDLVLASTAARTRQTTEHLLAGAGASGVDVWSARGIYDGGPSAVIAAVHEAPEDATTVWVVGHQPAVGMLTLALADPGDSDEGVLDEVGGHFPTAAAAVLHTHAVSWVDLGPGCARLVAFHAARG